MTKRVLFFAPFGSFQVHHQLDVMVGTALRFRGCEVNALLCDGLFPSCDVLAWSGENAARDCAACHMKSESLFSAFDFPRTYLKSLISEDDIIRATALIELISPEEYSEAIVDGLELGRWITSSIFSYFRIGFDSLHLPHVRRLHKQFLINGLLTWRALDNVASVFSPSHIFAFNGRFAPYRVALEYGKRHSIPVITHERGYIDDSFFLFKDHSSVESKPFFECIDKWRDIPLSPEEISLVKNNFLDRELGKGSNYTPFITYSTDIESIHQQLQIPRDKKIVSVFTSSEYELAYCDDFKTEISQIAALKELCEIFRNRSEYLVIRHHPYIGGSPSSPPDVRLLKQITKMSEELPSNVRVILPSEKLSTYALFWISAASVSFLSTAGIEAIVRGVPTASLPQSYYRDSMTEIMHDVSREGIEDTIERLLNRNGMVDAENLSRAYRTYHSIIGRLSQKFKSFGIRDIFEPDFRVSGPEDFLPGADVTLDRVCNHVLESSPLIPMPSADDYHQFSKEEERYIQKELETLTNQKMEVASKCQHALLRPQASIIQIELSSESTSPTNTWVSHSRLLPSEVRRVQLGDSFLSTLSALEDILAASSAQYVHLYSDRVVIGEAGISALASTLEDPSHSDAVASRLAGWLIDSVGVPKVGVFSERDPAPTLESLSGIRGAIRVPEIALSFHLFRRAELCRLIETWRTLENPEEVVRQLIDLTRENKLISLPLQNVLVTSSS